MRHGARRARKAKLAGVYPNANSGMAMNADPVSTDLFCVGDFLIIEPTAGGLRFDERMTLKEDYDFTAQHLAKHGAVARSNRVWVTALHYKNEGGAVADRNDEKEQFNIALLKYKWPGAIAKHPTRGENEVFFAWSRRTVELGGSTKHKRPPPPPGIKDEPLRPPKDQKYSASVPKAAASGVVIPRLGVQVRGTGIYQERAARTARPQNAHTKAPRVPCRPCRRPGVCVCVRARARARVLRVDRRARPRARARAQIRGWSAAQIVEGAALARASQLVRRRARCFAMKRSARCREAAIAPARAGSPRTAAVRLSPHSNRAFSGCHCVPSTLASACSIVEMNARPPRSALVESTVRLPTSARPPRTRRRQPACGC